MKIIHIWSDNFFGWKHIDYFVFEKPTFLLCISITMHWIWMILQSFYAFATYKVHSTCVSELRFWLPSGDGISQFKWFSGIMDFSFVLVWCAPAWRVCTRARVSVIFLQKDGKKPTTIQSKSPKQWLISVQLDHKRWFVNISRW